MLEDELAVMKPDMSSIDAFRAKAGRSLRTNTRSRGYINLVLYRQP